MRFSNVALLYQGNQVAIKKIKNHLNYNFQKPSIVAEFNMVMMECPNFCDTDSAPSRLNVSKLV